MMQSHLLHALRLSQIGLDQSPTSETKLETFDNLIVKLCEHAQCDGWLIEHDLSSEFFDAAHITMTLYSSMSA